MTPICTRVNAESIGPLLERLEGDTGVKWSDGGELPTEWDPLKLDVPTGVIVALSDVLCPNVQYVLERAEEYTGYGKLIDNDAFVAAIKEACPR